RGTAARGERPAGRRGAPGGGPPRRGGSRARGGGGTQTAGGWAGLERQDFLFRLLDDLVNRLTRFGHDFLGLLLRALDVVLTRAAAALDLLEHVEGVVASFANAHLAVFTVLLRDLDELLAPLLAERWN